MQIGTSHPQELVQKAASPTLERVADHLETALRHAEALRALERPAVVEAFGGLRVGAMIRQNREHDGAAQDARALELSIVLRLQQSCTLLNEAGRETPSRTALLRLLAIAAAPLAAADARAAIGPANDFFASRGLAPAIADAVALGEDYVVCGLVPLGALMDAVAAALDMLDTLRALPVR